MRSSLLSLVAISALALAFPQPQDVTLTAVPSEVPTEVPTRTEDVGTASATVTLEPSASGTAGACAAVADAVLQSGGESVAVTAQTAYNCLISIPINQTAAAITVEALVRMSQFQSTLPWLKDPPEGYANPPIDIIGGLQDIQTKVANNAYSNEYEFEAAMAELLDGAYDGHFVFRGMAYSGIFRWSRSTRTMLVSTSLDGGLPNVYMLRDLVSGTSNPSPVEQINGEPVVSFLQDEADRLTYHDPDTRYNALFYSAQSESPGRFVRPLFYPGPTTTILLANGTSLESTNAAVVRDPTGWADITGPSDVYQVFIANTMTPSPFKKRSLEEKLKHFPVHEELVQKREPKELQKRGVPADYPEPYMVHPEATTNLAGWFFNHPNITGPLAVIAMGTFMTETDPGTQQFQGFFDSFLAECRRRQAQHIIVDVSSNGGGQLFLGYEAFKQFFPDRTPFGGQRYRAHEAAEIIGSHISTLRLSTSTGLLYTSNFNYRFFLDDDLEPFTSFNDFYGPVNNHGDQATNVFRYNISDPLTTQNTRLSLGITITGYLDRPASNFTTTFRPENIVILSDGVCGSTCTLFLEFMTVHAPGVKTFTVGGLPRNGPTQPAGATKGSQVLPNDYLTEFGQVVVENFATSQREARDWLNVLPTDFGIATATPPTVNFKDTIREGGNIPTQFSNETSDCRLWYTPEMVLDISSVWSKVADVAWANSGNIDETQCVPGSSRNAQGGRGTPSASSASGSGSRSGSGSSNTSSGAATSNVVIGRFDWTPVIIAGISLLGMSVGMSLL